MPAAAVIPAPRAYTIIVAVKTPVVCHWVAGLLDGLAPSSIGSGPSGPWAGRSRGRWGTTSGSMLLHPIMLLSETWMAPAESPLHWGPTGGCTPNAGVGKPSWGGTQCVTASWIPGPTTGVRLQ